MNLTCNFCVKIAKVGLILMLYELYKIFYFNLYDNLIVAFLINTYF